MPYRQPPLPWRQKQLEPLGIAYREYLVQRHRPRDPGGADLVAYFTLRAHRYLMLEVRPDYSRRTPLPRVTPAKSA